MNAIVRGALAATPRSAVRQAGRIPRGGHGKREQVLGMPRTLVFRPSRGDVRASVRESLLRCSLRLFHPKHSDRPDVNTHMSLKAFWLVPTELAASMHSGFASAAVRRGRESECHTASRSRAACPESCDASLDASHPCVRLAVNSKALPKAVMPPMLPICAPQTAAAVGIRKNQAFCWHPLPLQ